MDTTKTNLPTLDSIFHAALEIDDPQERLAYLKSACGADSRLRERIESLLEADGNADGFFRTAEVVRGENRNARLPSDQTAPGEKSGIIIGRYKLLQQIGEGGFGTVWMAEQVEPVKRKVALKIIKLGMDTREVIARFEAERQALAMMDHPNIAKVLDGGATEAGRPFFVMELVRGIPITAYCDEHNLSTRERLELFIQICQAVQHAHQKGIIHRDLKPSNVMVTMHDDKAVPKVIDFGVAKATQTDLTEKTLYTRYEQFIGTPAYMSPEQAQLSGLDIDTRSDIYSLGVLLYELLTGNTPFDSRDLLKAGYDEIRRVIREEEPPKPSTRVNTLGDDALTELARHRKASPDKLEGILRGDLDWIIMMALEKDRTRRYDTAIGLAKDIQNHLEDEPVMAAAPSASYRLAKFVRRHRKPIGFVAVLALVLMAAGAIIGWQFLEGKAKDQKVVQAQEEKEEAESARRSAELLALGRKHILRALPDGDWEAVREALEVFVANPDPDKPEEFSRDAIKLAAVNLRLGDREAYQAVCARMLDELGEGKSAGRIEQAIRAYCLVPRDASDPGLKQLRELAYSGPELPVLAWTQLARGIVDFRLGNYSEAREQFSASIKLGNPKMQASVRPYLAMTAFKLGDETEAQRYLRGAEQALARLEEQDIDFHWHERVLSPLTIEEASALIDQR